MSNVSSRNHFEGGSNCCLFSGGKGQIVFLTGSSRSLSTDGASCRMTPRIPGFSLVSARASEQWTHRCFRVFGCRLQCVLICSQEMTPLASPRTSTTSASATTTHQVNHCRTIDVRARCRALFACVSMVTTTSKSFLFRKQASTNNAHESQLETKLKSSRPGVNSSSAAAAALVAVCPRIVLIS